MGGWCTESNGKGMVGDPLALAPQHIDCAGCAVLQGCSVGCQIHQRQCSITPYTAKHAVAACFASHNQEE